MVKKKTIVEIVKKFKRIFKEITLPKKFVKKEKRKNTNDIIKENKRRFKLIIWDKNSNGIVFMIGYI